MPYFIHQEGRRQIHVETIFFHYFDDQETLELTQVMLWHTVGGKLVP